MYVCIYKTSPELPLAEDTDMLPFALDSRRKIDGDISQNYSINDI
jgi:hypothetical protein